MLYGSFNTTFQGEENPFPLINSYHFNFWMKSEQAMKGK